MAVTVAMFAIEWGLDRLGRAGGVLGAERRDVWRASGRCGRRAEHVVHDRAGAACLRRCRTTFAAAAHIHISVNRRMMMMMRGAIVAMGGWSHSRAYCVAS